MILEDTKQKYIDKLGPKFGQMFHDVKEEWGYILYRYQEFMVLFGESEKRLALLNALSPGFTHGLQIDMSEALILGLCRLTDTDNRSVSVCHLPKFIRDKPNLKDEVECHVLRARSHACTARIRRNKWIAHRDKARTKTTVTYKDIKDGLDTVHAALNAITMDYCNQALMNEVISQKMSTARFIGSLESLIEGAMYIESCIDPDGESDPLNEKVSEAFVRKIGGDPSKDQVKIQDLRMVAQTIKRELDEEFYNLKA